MGFILPDHVIPGNKGDSPHCGERGADGRVFEYSYRTGSQKIMTGNPC